MDKDESTVTLRGINTELLKLHTAEGSFTPAISMSEYQRLAMRTCSIPYNEKKEMLRHAIFGLASEAGEVAGILQKEYQGHAVDLVHMRKELGDCLWMIAEACTAIGTDMSIVAQMNIDKLKARFPDGFSAEKSLNRAEGDI